jgi:hypothetical protein
MAQGLIAGEARAIASLGALGDLTDYKTFITFHSAQGEFRQCSVEMLICSLVADRFGSICIRTISGC